MLKRFRQRSGPTARDVFIEGRLARLETERSESARELRRLRAERAAQGERLAAFQREVATLEARLVNLTAKAETLESEKRELWDYVLMLRSAPPLGPREKKERENVALPPRPGLRAIRRNKLHNALLEMLKPEDDGRPKTDDRQPSAVSDRGTPQQMAARADEFADKVSEA
jgi:hypothetical protein